MSESENRYHEWLADIGVCVDKQCLDAAHKGRDSLSACHAEIGGYGVRVVIAVGDAATEWVDRMLEDAAGHIDSEVSHQDRSLWIMGWNDAEKYLASWQFLQLQDDGDSATAIILAEPEVRESHFRGQKRVQFNIPLLTEAGIVVWSMNKTTAKEVRRRWDELCGSAIRITRHGARQDTSTRYEIELLQDMPPGLQGAWDALDQGEVHQVVERLRAGESEQSADEEPPV